VIGAGTNGGNVGGEFVGRGVVVVVVVLLDVDVVSRNEGICLVVVVVNGSLSVVVVGFRTGAKSSLIIRNSWELHSFVLPLLQAPHASWQFASIQFRFDWHSPIVAQNRHH
jgi:hypothetical protein